MNNSAAPQQPLMRYPSTNEQELPSKLLASFCTRLGWVYNDLSDWWYPPSETSSKQFAFATNLRFSFLSESFILRMNWDPVVGVWMPFVKGDPDGPEADILRQCIDSDGWADVRVVWQAELENWARLAMYRRLGKRTTGNRTADGATTNTGTTVRGAGGAGLLEGDSEPAATAIPDTHPAAGASVRNGFVRVGSVWVRQEEAEAAQLAELVVRRRKRSGVRR